MIAGQFKRVARTAAVATLAVFWGGDALAASQADCTFFARAGFAPAGVPADGRSPSTAVARISDAARLVFNPGQVVCVGPGVYQEGNISPSTSGAPSAPIILRGDPTGQTTGDAPGRVVLKSPRDLGTGTPASTGFRLSGQKYIVVEGFTVLGFTEAGILVRVTDDGRISSDVAIRNNILIGNFSGITVRGARNVQIINNLVYYSNSHGIDIGPDGKATQRVATIGNTIFGNSGWGVRIGEGDSQSTDSVLANNIISQNYFGPVWLGRSSTCGYVAGFNQIDGAQPEDPNAPQNRAYDRYGSPLFADPTGPDGILGWRLVDGKIVDYSEDDDFHLRPESPAVDGGYAGATELGIQGSTARSGAADTGAADLGFHYGEPPSAQPLTAPPAPVMPIYVRATGSDANDGKDPGGALASLGRAAELATAGVTVIVGPGAYAAAGIGPPPYGGKAVFQADPSGELTDDEPGAVVVDPSALPSGADKDTGFLLSRACGCVVDGFHVRFAAAAGIQVRSGADGSIVKNNVIFTSSRGIEIVNANNVSIVNNLIYDNDDSGIRLRGGGGSTNVSMLNNTIYANIGDGIVIDDVSTGAMLKFNIIAESRGFGVVAGREYGGRFNLLNGNAKGNFGDDAGRVEGDRVDIDPLFVEPAGRDGRLGGRDFADDQFALRQVAAGQAETSPAVDLGPVSASAAGMAGGSTRTDGMPDVGPVDLGFHARALSAERLYVDPAGDDQNSGVRPATPLRTIAEALRRASEGTVVSVAAGTYREAGLRPPAGVRIAGQGGELTIIDAAGEDTVFDVRAAGVEIANVGVTGAGSAGVRARGDRLQLANCWIHANEGKGVIVPEGMGTLVFNNVVFGNGSTGVVIGSAGAGATAVTVGQNTIYGNRGFGVTVGLDAAAASPAVAVVNNLIAGNRSKGVVLGAASATSAQVGYNCNADGYEGIARPPTDVEGEPGLVDPARQPVPDFHLAQVPPGEQATSRCVDVGWRDAEALGLGEASTRTDGVGDGGRVDAGFHYNFTERPGDNLIPLLRFGTPAGDCDDDGVTRVNEVILAVNIALGYESLAACEVADVNGDGRVTIDEVLAAVAATLEQ